MSKSLLKRIAAQSGVPLDNLIVSVITDKPTKTLQYVKPNLDQFFYIHHWPTGHQELLFNTHADAAKFAKANGLEFTGPKN